MFKVLVVAYYFPPMGLTGVQRTLKFVKYMEKYNWQPTVITAGEVDYYAYDTSLAEELKNTGVRVVRTEQSRVSQKADVSGSKNLPREIFRKVFKKLSQSFLIPDDKNSWAKKAFAKAEDLIKEENFDAVFVTGPPYSSFHIFAQLKKKYNIPLIIDYRDLWFDSYFAFYPTPFHRSMHKKMEYDVLKAADRIIVSNRKIKEHILNQYQFLTFNDIVIITDGFDPEDFEKAKVVKKHNNRMILTYSGIFMVYNTPSYFLKAFKKITVEHPEIAKNIELHFLGFLRKENKRLVKKLKIEEFVFDHGFVDHKDVVARLLSSDVLWMTVGKRKNIDAILPGKFYEYIGAKKPVIACVPDGAAKLVVQEYPASYITDPENIDEIKETILKVYNHYQTNSFVSIDDEQLTNFRRDFLTEKLTKEFQFLIKADVQ
jgi:glycosyltransferase involved in cell wall biosynthesis